MPNKNTTLANLADIVNVDGNLFPTTVKVANLPIATTAVVGIVRPDNTTITIDANGVLTAIGGGGGGGSFSSVTVVWTNSNSATKAAYSAPNTINNDGLTFNLVASANPGTNLSPATINLNNVPVTGLFSISGGFPNYSIVVPIGSVTGLAAQTAATVTVGVVIGSQFNLTANNLTNTPQLFFTASVTGRYQQASYPYYVASAPIITNGTSGPNAPSAFTLSIAGQSITTFSSFTTSPLSITATATISGTVTGNGQFGAGSTTVNINSNVPLPGTFTPAFYAQTSDLNPPNFTTSSSQTSGGAPNSTITYPAAVASTQYNWIATNLPLSRILFVTDFGNTPLIPDVTAPTQTISTVVFNVYGFTRLDVGSQAQLYITPG